MGEVFLIILWLPAIIGMPLLPIMGLYGVVVSIPALFKDKVARWLWAISFPLIWWIGFYLYEQQELDNLNNPSVAGNEYIYAGYLTMLLIFIVGSGYSYWRFFRSLESDEEQGKGSKWSNALVYVTPVVLILGVMAWLMAGVMKGFSTT